MNALTATQNKLKSFPKAQLGFFPTPLHRLNNVSTDLGINLFIKREDFSGVNLFGGNKIRKLEYVLGDAQQQGCTKIMTYGATQSNHAMQTVTACRQLGLDPILLLAEFVKPDYQDLRSNFLLDYIMDADVSTIPFDGGSIASLTENIQKLGAKKIAEFEAQGHKCYCIPPGANNVEGAMGVLDAFIEIKQQMLALNQPIDYIIHATGTGGSLSGLALGKAIAEDNHIEVISIAAAPVESGYKQAIVNMANDLSARIGSNSNINIDDLNINADYIGPGYELPSEAGTEAIRYLAKTEGLLADPVYSGKAFAGLMDMVKTGKIKAGSNVVFIHTGGATALFAERDIVGNVSATQL